MYRDVLCCFVLCCIDCLVLVCIVLFSVLFAWLVEYGAVLYRTALICIVLSWNVLCYAALHCMCLS